MRYRVLRTDRANDQIISIVNYIADQSSSIDQALEFLDRIEEGILSLAELPNRGFIPRYSILKRQGFRILKVEKLLVFYKVNEKDKSVIVYAIVHEKQSYLNFL